MAKSSTTKIATRPIAASRFTDNGDGTVTDSSAGLMWSKETLAAGEIDHAAAVKACKALQLAGRKEWRLPTVKELFLLVDRSRRMPAIDIDVFPGTKSAWYWTSTPTAWDPSCAWVVYFDSGYASYYRPVNDAFVRAVRSARASQ